MEDLGGRDRLSGGAGGGVTGVPDRRLCQCVLLIRGVGLAAQK